METRRGIVAAGMFWAGAVPLFILCALASPFMYPLTVGVGFLALIPLSCVVPALLGVQAAHAAWRAWTPETPMPAQSWGGYFLGVACLITYLFLLGIAVAHRGGPDDLTTYAIACMVFSMLPAIIICLGLFYGAWLAAPLEALFGFPREAATKFHTLTLGFRNGGLTVLPAFCAVLFEFNVGQAWARTNAAQPATFDTPLPAILGETLRGAVFLAAVWLHQTVLLLLLARFRAARQGGLAAPPAFLRLLCLLSILIFGILLATLFSASHTPGE